jgi:glycerophosphoryl diester phosphodiesterase
MHTLLIGHRGARGERPENTLAGFVHARAVGVDGIETDIAVTADDVPVLHHDPHLADGRLILETRFADLPAEVPSLARALRAVPDLDWLLEVKTFPKMRARSHPPARMVAAVLAALAGFSLARLRLLAFEWEVLREAARQAPALRRICLTAPDMAAARGLWWGEGFGAMTVPQAVTASGAQGWAAYHGKLSEAEMDEARRLGLDIFAWTVNEVEDFHRLDGQVTGIISDFPTRSISWNDQKP